MKKRLLLFLIVFTLAVQFSTAQDGETVTVPDVTGLNVPQAAAALNQAGLRLGNESAAGLADPNITPNTITAQAIPAGQSAPRGAAIDISTARANNALVIYDDNDLTFINLTGGALNLSDISFNALDGSIPAVFFAANWSGALGAGDCGQIWSEPVRSAKNLPECTQSTLWRSTSDTAQHFWTGAGGATQFGIFQNGVQRAICPVVNPGRCEFYLQGGQDASDMTPYVYLVYTAQHFMILNRAADQWMPLAQTFVVGVGIEGGGPVVPGDLNVFDDPAGIIGNPQQLAPGQCVSYTNNADAAPLLQDCYEIARSSLNIAGPLFWNADFQIFGATTGGAATCPAANAERLTICIVPR